MAKKQMRGRKAKKKKKAQVTIPTKALKQALGTLAARLMKIEKTLASLDTTSVNKKTRTSVSRKLRQLRSLQARVETDICCSERTQNCAFTIEK